MENSPSELFIVDNSDSDWKVRSYLSECCQLSKSMDIATGYFEIGALLCLNEVWQSVDHIRILMATKFPTGPNGLLLTVCGKSTSASIKVLKQKKSKTISCEAFPLLSKRLITAKFNSAYIEKINSMPKLTLPTDALP